MDAHFFCSKTTPPIEFLNVGMTSALMSQMLLSGNFFMDIKFVDLAELCKFDFHKKCDFKKQLSHQGVCHTNIEKYYRWTNFSLFQPNFHMYRRR